MEDTLRDNDIESGVLEFGAVLILVLMEDTLRDTSRWTNFGYDLS